MKFKNTKLIFCALTLTAFSACQNSAADSAANVENLFSAKTNSEDPSLMVDPVAPKPAPAPVPVVVAPQIPTQPLPPRTHTQQSLDSCLQFLDAALSTTNNSGDDISIVGIGGNRTIESARTVNVTSVSGDLIVLAATNVEHNLGVSGKVWINSEIIEDISSVSGALCLNATHINNLNSISGDAKIKAITLNSLSVHSGTTHLYGTRVENILSNSGQICLHDGALILNAQSVSGTISSSCAD